MAKEYKKKTQFYESWGFALLVALMILSIVIVDVDENGIRLISFAKIAESATEDTAEENEILLEDSDTDVVITAKQLGDEYSDNVVRADKNYKGKTAVITGEIAWIEKDNIALRGSDSFGNEYVKCYFEDKEEIDKIADIDKGDTVTIMGQIEGSSLRIEKCQFK